jgi:hypothetical protein
VSVPRQFPGEECERAVGKPDACNHHKRHSSSVRFSRALSGKDVYIAQLKTKIFLSVS